MATSITHSHRQLKQMRPACQLAAETLVMVGRHLRPGMTTEEINTLVHEYTLQHDAIPAPLNYKGFPKSVCTSVNEVICHGIPDSRPRADGDIINIDVTLFCEGVHGDTSTTFLVGEVDDASRRLVRETARSLDLAIDAVKPGGLVNEIGKAIENHARQHRLGVVREFIGHGVGTEFHTNLQIPHYYERRLQTRIEPMVSFTIEPMLTLGEPHAALWDDDWTAVTIDGTRTAQFEHTLVMTDDGAERLTVTAAGACAHDYVATMLV